MTNDEELVRTVHIGVRIGLSMTRNRYNTIKEFILTLLAVENVLTINTLIEKGHKHFADDLGENTGLHLYYVKMDLEARGLIKNQRPGRKSMNRIILKSLQPKILMRHSAASQHQDFKLKKKAATKNNDVKQKFIDLFGGSPLIVNSPGRINLIGEHTDYNNGFVMPAAIDKGIKFAIAPCQGSQSTIYSVRYKQSFSIDYSNLERVTSNTWINYLLGILYQIKIRDLKIQSFNCVFDGDLPLGAGLSSSAALECGFVFALNQLFNLGLSCSEMIHIAQWAEHNYVGVKCGIMDQFASMMGQVNKVMILDCQSLTCTYYPFDLKNYCLLLCDTNVKHSLASSEYNTRRKECEEGIAILQTKHPNIKSVRDFSLEKLIENKKLFPETVFKRCLYVVEENNRVLKASEDLLKGNLKAFGQKMFKTHEGLSEFYEVSCPELDFLVDQAKQYEGILGSRMMGGGFGGCTLNIVKNDIVNPFIRKTRMAYKAAFGLELNSYVVKIGNGTSVIENPFTRNI